MPILRDIMRKKREDYFIRYIGKNDKILEIGSGDSWFKDFLRKNGRENYVSIDIANESADIKGDILLWRELGLSAGSFDVIVAFEVVEHVDCFEACFDLLKKGGRLLLTTPVPHMDWMLRIMEAAGLNQKRTSPHNHLVYLKNAPGNWSEKLITRGGGGGNRLLYWDVIAMGSLNKMTEERQKRFIPRCILKGYNLKFDKNRILKEIM